MSILCSMWRERPLEISPYRLALWCNASTGQRLPIADNLPCVTTACSINYGPEYQEIEHPVPEVSHLVLPRANPLWEPPKAQNVLLKVCACQYAPPIIFFIILCGFSQ